MKVTLRHIYLCRTANISWRTCVVVKQIQSNPTSQWLGLYSAYCVEQDSRKSTCDLSTSGLNYFTLTHLFSSYVHTTPTYVTQYASRDTLPQYFVITIYMAYMGHYGNVSHIEYMRHYAMMNLLIEVERHIEASLLKNITCCPLNTSHYLD